MCGFNLYSLMTTDFEHLFMYLLAFLYIVFGEMSVQGLGPFFNWVGYLFIYLLLSCRSSLYVLGLISLLDMWFVNTFFHSVHCLHFDGFFCCAEALFCCSPTCLFFILLLVL